jgi:hypothetical protein
VRDNLRVKEVRVGEGEKAKRFIICHNPVEDQRQRAQRKDTIKRLEAELDRIDKQRPKTKNAKAAEAHTAAGARSKTTPRSDLLSTSDPDQSAEDVAVGYKTLLEAERGFRDLKNRDRAAADLPPPQAPHPRARPALLAHTATDPRRLTPHRVLTGVQDEHVGGVDGGDVRA